MQYPPALPPSHDSVPGLRPWRRPRIGHNGSERATHLLRPWGCLATSHSHNADIGQVTHFLPDPLVELHRNKPDSAAHSFDGILFLCMIRVPQTFRRAGRESCPPSMQPPRHRQCPWHGQHFVKPTAFPRFVAYFFAVYKYSSPSGSFNVPST